VFGPLRSTVVLGTDEIDELVIGMAEQFGKTISHARPLVDATLPEGSRINIVFGRDVSKRGTNATIRRFAAVPLSITQIISSKTMDSMEAAYLWMMAEQGMSMFINGETASGKTTTMMGVAAFIPSNWKVVSIEDTPEITIPHNNWISEVTRDTGSAASSVTMFDLLKAALRQRPNYILVGEIRGAEANIAFQAMQTGHPVISTFHAAQMSSLIQRLVGEPMKIPKPNMDNLNVALFQAAVQGKDGRPARRVLSINEIVGYNPGNDSVMFIPVFNWDPSSDSVTFRGKGSSNLFLTKVLLRRGMSRKDEGLLYDELALRARVLDAMVKKKVFNYYEVYEHIVESRRVGLEALLKGRLA
jgi:flagellar protein FlaI